MASLPIHTFALYQMGLALAGVAMVDPAVHLRGAELIPCIVHHTIRADVFWT